MMCVQELDPDTTATSPGCVNGASASLEMCERKQSGSDRHNMVLRSSGNIDLPCTPACVLAPASSINKSTLSQTTRRRQRKCSAATVFALLDEPAGGPGDVDEDWYSCTCVHALINSYTACPKCHCVRGQCAICEGVASADAVEAGLVMAYTGARSYASPAVVDVDGVGPLGDLGEWEMPCSMFLMSPLHSVCLCRVGRACPDDDVVTIDKT